MACREAEEPNFSGFYDNLPTHLNSDKHNGSIKSEHMFEIEDACKAYKELRATKGKDTILKANDPKLCKLKMEYTAFLLQNELSFTLSTKLIEFNRRMIIEYTKEAVCQVTMSDKTASAIARNCLNKTYKEEVFSKIANHPFSISLDESSDQFGPTFLAVSVRYIYNSKVYNKLISLTDLKRKTGEALFEELTETVFPPEFHSTFKKNCVGICTDGAYAMSSSGDAGLVNRLKVPFPDLIHVKDVSHCLNLVSNWCLNLFSTEAVSLIKHVCGHFRGSNLRRQLFMEISQNLHDDNVQKALKVLNYTPTRWSSLYKSAKRILLLWDQLEAYFTKYSDTDVCPLLHKENQVQLVLMECLLERLKELTDYFQTDNTDHGYILTKFKKEILIWAASTLKKDYLDFSTIKQLPFENLWKLEMALMPIKEFQQVFLDKYEEFKGYMKTMSTEFMAKIIKTARSFIVKLIELTLKYIPFRSPILNDCDILLLEEPNDEKWLRLAQTLLPFTKWPSLRGFKEELASFNASFVTLKAKLDNQESHIAFWSSQFREYPRIRDLSIIILTLPYSTCNVERSFSMLKDIKYDRRNKLSVETVEAALLMHQELKGAELNITPEMIDNYAYIWHKVEPDNDVSPSVKEKEKEKRKEKEEEDKNFMTEIIPTDEIIPEEEVLIKETQGKISIYTNIIYKVQKRGRLMNLFKELR